MPATLLQVHVDSATAARVHLHAEKAGSPVEEWLAAVIRREVHRSGAADSLALQSYEMAATIGYMLRALMIDSIGPEATEKEIEEAARAASDLAAAELERALEIF